MVKRSGRTATADSNKQVQWASASGGRNSAIVFGTMLDMGRAGTAISLMKIRYSTVKKHARALGYEPRRADEKPQWLRGNPVWLFVSSPGHLKTDRPSDRKIDHRFLEPRVPSTNQVPGPAPGHSLAPMGPSPGTFWPRLGSSRRVVRLVSTALAPSLNRC
jgi:hypothetical protein